MSTAAPPVSAAPVAGAPVDAAPPVSAGAAEAVHCENCGAEVTGRYCGACGQRLEPPLHSLWHFLTVATEDLTHADSRLWRTLGALLLRPGFLTRQFLDGRRARYLPPVRLYLVLSVVFFIWFSATHQKMTVLHLDAPRSASSAAAVAPGRHEYGLMAPAQPDESLQQRAERVCPDLSHQGPWQDSILRRVTHACRLVVLDDGRSVREAFLHNAPRAMFLFLPLLAAGMMLLYWRPRHYYVEHLLVFVHNHAFVFLLLLLAAGVSALLPVAEQWVRFAVCVYIPWYVYRSMRLVYGQGRWLTFGKLLLLSLFYLVSGALMLALTIAYSGLSL
ncbi:MAG TPA: DUF3667 domain-containing protein [Steroidobacteraceae bacterium]|jgi:hypothetical protein|nr:DUF3667 domain-containing protein [Steroidobacteraceae bacterium]